MKKDFSLILPNDHIYLEEDDMWFVSVEGNELCRGRLSTEECEYVAQIPVGSEGSLRSAPFCLKYKNTIVCLPDTGADIWLYNLEQKNFHRIVVDNPQNVRLIIINYKLNGAILWAWAGEGLRRLVEIDLEKRQIQAYYRISEDDTAFFARQIASYKNFIYFFENNEKVLYAFDIVSKEIEKYNLQEVKSNIISICSDGEFFWLAGEEECIYTWCKTTQELIRHANLPTEFQVIRSGKPSLSYQKWIFYKSACLNEWVCFVPWNDQHTICNSIIFMNKKTYQMKAMKIYDETTSGNGRYVLEYVIEDRCVGIHYQYNDFISEIDTSNFEIKRRHMKFTIEDYTKLLYMGKSKGKILVEKNIVDLPAFINDVCI